MKRFLSCLSRKKQTVALAAVSVLLVMSVFRLCVDLRAFGNVASYAFSGLYNAFYTAADQAGDEPYGYIGAQFYEDAYTELFTLDELARTSLVFRRYTPGGDLQRFVSRAAVEKDPAQQEKNLTCISQIADLLEPIWNMEPRYSYLSDPDGIAEIVSQVKDLAQAAYPTDPSGQ